MTTHSGQPLLLLVQAHEAPDHHRRALIHAGFRVHDASDLTQLERDVLTIRPALIAIDLAVVAAVDVFRWLSRLHGRADAPDIPVIVYAEQLQAEEIASAARARPLWVQISAADDLKLVAAIRGVLAAGGAEGVSS
jgi:DNA-binding NarL/FixJ family response regulator